MFCNSPFIGFNKRLIRHNDLTIMCDLDDVGKLESKEEFFSTSILGYELEPAMDPRYVHYNLPLAGREHFHTSYVYERDPQGHLTAVRRDGERVEKYTYNERGQRIRQQPESTWGDLLYDPEGRLVRAGDISYTYDANGALASRLEQGDTVRFRYGKDTRLDSVVLSTGVTLSYEYGLAFPQCPVKRFMGGQLVSELAWADETHLAGYRDYYSSLEYLFQYNESGFVDKVYLYPFKHEPVPSELIRKRNNDPDWLVSIFAEIRGGRVYEFIRERGTPYELTCSCDQVGTPKVFVDKYGKLVKMARCDSFGRLLGDSFAELFMPVGFAGGLVDQDTRLVRFGYRDYDPQVGRFTAPDPAEDRRGDGDLYDYCMDDPVSFVDPSGLAFEGMPEGSQKKQEQAEEVQATAKPDNSKERWAERSFAEAFDEGMGNVGPSATKFAKDLVKAVSHPGETTMGILSVMDGYFCQMTGIKSHTRPASDKVTEYFAERYGSSAQFKKTLAEDPVGVAADMSTFFTSGGGALRGMAKAGSIASKALPAGNAAVKLGKGADALNKVGAGMGKIGATIDPLAIPGAVGKKMVRRTLPTVKNKVPSLKNMAIPEAFKNSLPNLTAASRVRKAVSGTAKTTAGVGGTITGINEAQEEKDKKK